MSAQAVEPDGPPAEHPAKPTGEPYAFGGYAYLKLGCRCAGCMDAQLASSQKAAAGRKRASRAGDKIRSDSPVSAVASDLAGEAKAKAAQVKGGASQKALEHGAAQLLVYLSIGYVMLAARGLPLADEQTDALALADDEAEAIAAPLARVFAGTELNSRYGKSLTENMDVLEAVVTAGSYVRRTTKVLTQIRAEVTRPAGGPGPAPQPTGGPHAPAPPPRPRPEPGPAGAGEEPAPPRPSYAPFTPGDNLRADL